MFRSKLKMFFNNKITNSDNILLKSKYLKVSNYTKTFIEKPNYEKIKSVLLFISKSTKLSFQYGIIPTTKYFALPVTKKYLFSITKHISKTNIGKTFFIIGGSIVSFRFYYVYETNYK